MKLSVVITAYNVSEFIAKCISSVQEQELKDGHELEIVVVEDKSTDNTLEILKGIEGIVLVENEVNVGAGLSRRFGIQKSTGDYVMLVDGDDYLEGKQHLQTLIDKAVESDADVVGGGIKILREDGSYDSTSYGNYSCEGYEKISKFWGERIVFMNNKIIRRTMYDKIPYCHRRYIEDTPTIIPILWLANKVEYVDVIGYVYRMRAASLTHQSDELKNMLFKGLCWCDLLEFFNINDPEVFNHISIKNFVGNIINMFNNRITTLPEIQLYSNEFAEFMFRLLNLVKITGIDFKDPQINK